VPTPDHFVPLLYLAGLAGAEGRPAATLVEGYAYGSLSMTSYTLGVRCPESGASEAEPAAIPDPEVAPAEDCNM